MKFLFFVFAVDETCISQFGYELYNGPLRMCVRPILRSTLTFYKLALCIRHIEHVDRYLNLIAVSWSYLNSRCLFYMEVDRLIFHVVFIFTR